MSNPVLEAISQRRSIRGYKPEQITTEELDLLLKAAQESPSANNSQPWHFSIVQNKELLQEINAEVKAKLQLKLDDLFFAAPSVIFISCDANSRWGRLDSGIAVENIAIAAQAIGLGSVILGLPEPAFTGEKGEYFNKALKFPEGHSFAVAIAVGYPTTTKEAHPLKPDRIVYIP
jgi:nitroreductase